MEHFINAVRARISELYSLLGELVRFDSQNFGASGREELIARHIAQMLSDLNIAPDLYSPEDIPGIRDCPDYWPGHNLENRYNVTGILPGSDHSRRIMLAGHIDTVPIGNPDNWSFDPFCGTVRDGKILGRGACDDKYAIAVVLFLFRLLRDEGITLPYDVVFTAYCDEEYGGGNGTLAACLRYPCDDIINLDCKNFEIWAAASGGGVLRTHIRSLTPRDSCAGLLQGLAMVLEEFERFRLDRMNELEEKALYHGTMIPRTCIRFMELKAGDNGADLDRAHADITFYTCKTSEETQSALNELKARLDPRLRSIGLCFDRFEMTTRFFHFMESAVPNRAMELLQEASVQASGRTLQPSGSCLSDLSLFIKYGSPRAFAFGIGRDFSVYGGAHQTDEYLECEPLAELAETLGTFLMKY